MDAITTIEQAKEEFKDEIMKHLTNKLSDEYQMEEFLYSVDFVNYEVDSNGLQRNSKSRFNGV